MEAPEISWRPLGRLFVEKGLLSEERLEHALAEQIATGGRLGEKLVELGYVTTSALARLLAEQYGVEITFETGFGTGLRAELERRHESSAQPPVSLEDEGPTVLHVVPSAIEVEPKNGDPLTPLAGLEEQWARLAAAEARVAEVEAELEQMRQTVAQTATEDVQRRSARNGARSRS